MYCTAHWSTVAALLLVVYTGTNFLDFKILVTALAKNSGICG